MRQIVWRLAFAAACSIGLSVAGEPPVITKQYVDLRGGQVHYVRAGSGPVVLLLHQAPLSHAEFLPTIPLLADHYTVVAWDAPGHGSSYMPPGECGFLEYLGVLHELIETLGLERVHIVGNHSGAAFAREYAAVIPERVGKIVLCGSAFEPPEPKTELVEATEFLSQRGRGLITFCNGAVGGPRVGLRPAASSLLPDNRGCPPLAPHNNLSGFSPVDAVDKDTHVGIGEHRCRLHRRPGCTGVRRFSHAGLRARRAAGLRD